VAVYSGKLIDRLFDTEPAFTGEPLPLPQNNYSQINSELNTYVPPRTAYRTRAKGNSHQTDSWSYAKSDGGCKQATDFLGTPSQCLECPFESCLICHDR
jgi:hypothetical protein